MTDMKIPWTPAGASLEACVAAGISLSYDCVTSNGVIPYFVNDILAYAEHFDAFFQQQADAKEGVLFDTQKVLLVFCHRDGDTVWHLGYDQENSGVPHNAGILPDSWHEFVVKVDFLVRPQIRVNAKDTSRTTALSGQTAQVTVGTVMPIVSTQPFQTPSQAENAFQVLKGLKETSQGNFLSQAKLLILQGRSDSESRSWLTAVYIELSTDGRKPHVICEYENIPKLCS